MNIKKLTDKQKIWIVVIVVICLLLAGITSMLWRLSASPVGVYSVNARDFPLYFILLPDQRAYSYSPIMSDLELRPMKWEKVQNRIVFSDKELSKSYDSYYYLFWFTFFKTPDYTLRFYRVLSYPDEVRDVIKQIEVSETNEGI